MGVRTNPPGDTDTRLHKYTHLFIGGLVAQFYRERKRNFMGRVSGPAHFRVWERTTPF